MAKIEINFTIGEHVYFIKNFQHSDNDYQWGIAGSFIIAGIMMNKFNVLYRSSLFTEDTGIDGINIFRTEAEALAECHKRNSKRMGY